MCEHTRSEKPKPTHTMKHTLIQIEPTQATQAINALNAHAIRHSTVDGDCLKVPAHDDGLKIERILKQSGVLLFSYPCICDGSGY